MLSYLIPPSNVNQMQSNKHSTSSSGNKRSSSNDDNQNSDSFAIQTNNIQKVCKHYFFCLFLSVCFISNRPCQRDEYFFNSILFKLRLFEFIKWWYDEKTLWNSFPFTFFQQTYLKVLYTTVWCCYYFSFIALKWRSKS